ncbi:MAG: hypothetical protein JXR88_01020 [Clostridia bacterium]|nr:hypothetical protein [Clostridia bacterium]
MYDIEIFVPILLKFQNDGIVFTENELEDQKGVKEKYFKKKEMPSHKFENGFDYEFKDEDLKKIKGKFIALYQDKLKEKHDENTEEKQKNAENLIQALEVEFYYYHHRIIFIYRIKFSKGMKLSVREVRSLVNENYKDLVEKHLIPDINTLVYNKKINADGLILSYYSYMFLIVKGEKYPLKALSDKLGSLTFRIIQSSKRLFKYADQHFVRISIPSTILYASSKIDIHLKVDMINSIYQHCLYTKKDEDIIKFNTNEISEFDVKNVREFNIINEGILIHLWEYLMDSLGGNASINQAHKISRRDFQFSIFVILLTLISLIAAFK